MSRSTISAYSAIIHTAGDEVTLVGDTKIPREVTGANATQGQCTKVKPLLVAASAKVLLWDGTITGALRDWSAFYLRLKEGALQLTWMIDTPVSESNLAASGTNPFAVHESVSNFLAMQKDNNRVLMNPTDADQIGFTAGVPEIWNEGVPGAGGATNLYAKYYKLFAWNLSTTVAAVGEMAIMD
jgi:hypothetical protein